ncbi:MAG: 50S ribosomal protein L4, partial [Candidatus Aphodocola sp.]
MMKLDILNTNGEKVKDLTLNKEIFGIEPNDKVLKDAIIVAQSSLRQGTAKTKNRSEVSGGGRKPWKQKGTGRARQGSIRAVQWVGGGRYGTPVPRDYSKKMNRKERVL